MGTVLLNSQGDIIIELQQSSGKDTALGSPTSASDVCIFPTSDLRRRT